MNTAFEHPVTVRWRDTDALGHVNHVVFLTYLEEARDAFYRQVLGSEPHYVMARLEIDFRTEIRYEDGHVLVQIEVEHVGTTSLTTREKILNHARQVAARARVVTVRWDSDRRESTPFSEAERERLEAQRERLEAQRERLKAERARLAQGEQVTDEEGGGR